MYMPVIYAVSGINENLQFVSLSNIDVIDSTSLHLLKQISKECSIVYKAQGHITIT